MKSNYIRFAILIFFAGIRTKEAACTITQFSFFSKIKNNIEKISNFEDYLANTYPDLYEWGRRAIAAGALVGFYFMVVHLDAKRLHEYLKPIIQDYNYDLDRLSKEQPNFYKQYEKQLKELVINSKDPEVVYGRMLLLLERIYDRLYMKGEHEENFSNKELIEREDMQSINEFIKLYQHQAYITFLDKEITNIKQNRTPVRWRLRDLKHRKHGLGDRLLTFGALLGTLFLYR